MDPETPKYMRPTRSSLGRVTPKVKPSTSTPKDKMDAKRLEQQRQLVRLRIASAEKLRQLLPPSEKWPTVSSVEMHRKSLLRSLRTAPAVAFLSMQPTRTPVGDTSSTLASQQPAISPVDFPFQASSVRDLSVFPQFGFLPAELRLQIWEQAVFNPKFIEIQYYTDSPNPRIVNHRRYDPLYSVCKESRDVAQALAGSSVVRPMSRVVLHSPRWNARRSHLPIPEPTFVPERDTLFFRPMDHSLENRVITLWSAFRGLHRIEHIAIPLDLKRPIPHSAQWISDMSDRFFLNLKTLTFMLGCEEKSWLGDASIELRDLEQWCMDGRKRTMKFDHGRWWAAMQHYDDKSPFDITELSSRMVAEDEQRYKRVMVGRKPLKVRVVAWKRKV